MKFAENLSENLVPEWRDKYLDYKGGKKKIKKITNSPSFLAKGLNATPKIGTDRLRGLGSRSANVVNSSFELPPAAISPNDIGQQQPQNDKTPLLEPERQISNAQVKHSSPSEVYSRRAPRTPRSAVHSDTYGGGSAVLNAGYQMDSMNDTSIFEFTEWLDKQLEMIESFYKEREDHVLERYLLLQDQLFHLREEKLKFKAKGQPETDEIIKRGLAKTTNNLTKLNRYNLPSFPSNPFKRTKKEDDQLSNGKKDYERKHEISYYSARRQLKTAVLEHYRELELLKSYRMLNRTGFRKLLKKFDKRLGTNISPGYMEKVDHSHFGSSDVLENMTPKVEDMYSTNFENGNRKVAVEKLRSNLSHDQFYSEVFITGLFYGLAIPLFVSAVYIGVHKTVNDELPMGRYILQIWAGFFLLLLMAMLFAICCIVWNNYKINYRFIFEFNPKTALNYRQFSLLPSIMFFSLSLFMWFGFNDFWPKAIPSRFWPWFFFGSGVLLMFFPFNALFLESRKWIIVTLWRLFLSGLYPVEFKDFFLGDIFSSLSYTMGNLSFFFCMYATNWQDVIEGELACGSSRSHLMGFFSALPAVWRLLQCLRRYADSGDWFPHLANMGKYSFTVIYYATLSVYRIHSTTSNRAVFILFATINSVFSGLWDIFMDWSLMQNKRMLRDDIIFPAEFYYFSMVWDLVLRFQWVFYVLFSRQIQQAAVTSFCIAVAEILRRFVWLLIRMENEHLANTHLFKASREVPLPYNTIRRPERQRSESQEDSAISTGYSSTGRPEGDEEQQQIAPTHGAGQGIALNSGVLRNVSLAIVNAHKKDFQRRKSTVDDDPAISSEEENSDDDS